MRSVRNSIGQKISKMAEMKDYGQSVSYWGHISIVNPSSVYDKGFYPEVKKYSGSKKEVELRLKIDYDDVVNGDEKKLYTLFTDSILRGVHIAESELKIDDFDFKRFRADLNELFSKEGWL